MAKKATAKKTAAAAGESKKPAAAKPATPATKKPAAPKKKKAASAVFSSPELDALSEDQLRDRAREDMNAYQRRGAESGVEMIDVMFHKDTYVRELGRTVRAGEVEPLPCSVVAFYARKDKGTFGEEEVAEEQDDGADEAAKKAQDDAAAKDAEEAAKKAAGDVKPDEVTGQHNPEGTVQN